MKHFFAKKTGVYRLALAALGLLAAPAAAQAQSLSTIYLLGTVTGNSLATTMLGLSVGQQVLYPADPASIPITATNYTNGRLVVGVAAGQQLVGLDIRPATGQLYALGYDNSAAKASANNAQLYVLGVGATAVATPVGSAFNLALGTSTPRNTAGSGTYTSYTNLVVGVGFDFNPRADRIRITGLNRANYVLNPNTGAAVRQADLVYNVSNVDPDRQPLTPYIGTVAYTQSVLGGGPTTLYDLDQTPRHGVLSTQSLTNPGELTQLKQVRLTGTNQNGTTFNATIDNATFDLDIFTDGTTKTDHAYLLELTTPDAPGASHNSSNLYDFDLSTGIASTKSNIIGGSPRSTLFFTNLAAAARIPFIWTGAQDINWQNPNNWSTNVVPTATDDAVIPSNGTLVQGLIPQMSGPNTPGIITVSRQPTVSTAQPVHTITLNGETGNPSMLTLAPGGTLSVYGDFVNSAGQVLGSGTGTVALTGPTAPPQNIIDTSVPGYTHFQNLSIGQAGANVSGTAEVQRVLTLTGNLNLTGATSFTLLSNINGTATVVPKGGVATGKAIVQRDIESTYLGVGYRHYSSPVANTTLSDLNTATFTPLYTTSYNTSAAPRSTQPFPTIYGYSQQQFETSIATDGTTEFNKGFYVPAGGNVPWQPGVGYTVHLDGSELEDFRGTLTTGTHATPPQGRSGKADAGWQLLGNPYPSILDWNQVAATGLTNMDDAVYVYAANGPYVGTYTSYINGASTNGGSRYIAVAHGILVRTTAGAGSGYITFQDGQRATSYQPTVFQRSAATRPQLLLELTDGHHACQAAVYFEAGATANFDSHADAYTLPFMNGLALATPTADAAFDLSINGLPALTGATVRVPLRIAATTAGTYALRVAELAGLPTGYRALLHDATLGTDTDLSLTDSVPVSLVPTYAPARYSLVFTTSSALATLPASLASQIAVYPNPAHGRAALVLPAALRGGQPATVRVLNQLDQTVGTALLPATGPDTVELPVANLAAGIYTVQVSTHAGQAAQRLTLE